MFNEGYREDFIGKYNCEFIEILHYTDVQDNQTWIDTGGTSISKRRVLDNFTFKISGYNVEYGQIVIKKYDNPFFDGWMGIDVFKNKRVILDFPKGQLLLEN